MQVFANNKRKPVGKPAIVAWNSISRRVTCAAEPRFISKQCIILIGATVLQCAPLAREYDAEGVICPRSWTIARDKLNIYCRSIPVSMSRMLPAPASRVNIRFGRSIRGLNGSFGLIAVSLMNVEFVQRAVCAIKIMPLTVPRRPTCGAPQGSAAGPPLFRPRDCSAEQTSCSQANGQRVNVPEILIVNK